MRKKKVAGLPFLSNRDSPIALSNDCIVEKCPISRISVAGRAVRNIGKRAIAATSAVFSKHGQVLPILVSHDGVVIAGHEVVQAARDLGMTHLNVVRIEGISDVDRRILTVALAKIPLLSTWNDDELRAELAELFTLDLDDLADRIAFSEGELDVILDPCNAQAQPDPLDAGPGPSAYPGTVTEASDVWILGRHRIICGDSREAENLLKLMGGKKVRMLLTDPPWNIRIAGNVSGLGKFTHEDFAMGAGEMSRGEFTSFLRTMLLLSIAHLVDGALVYVFMDRKKLGELLEAAADAKLKIIDLCIWNKQSGAMGGLYRGQHEPCLVFKHGDAPYLNNVQLGKYGRYRTNMWEHPGLSSFGKGREDALAMHPTVKPVALLAEAIKDCTKRGEVVFDPFAGSGSTIIAAEKTGRVGYGIELEPKYVDLTVRRWEAMTGREAVHEASGVTFSEMRERRAEDARTAEPARQPSGADLNASNQGITSARIRKRPMPPLEVTHG